MRTGRRRVAWAATLVFGLGAVELVSACATSARVPGSAYATSDPRDAAAEDQADETTDDALGGEGEPAPDASTERAVADPPGPCSPDMVLVSAQDVRVCVDRYEASLVESDANGAEKAYPHWLPVDGHTVRAVSVPGVYPQGYISEVQAEDACAASGKRLCSHAEWKAACMGPARSTFPYGDARRTGVCHDSGKSAVGAVFGLRALASPVAPTAAPQRKPSANGGARSGRPVASGPRGRAAETSQSRPSRDKSASAKPASGKKSVRASAGSARGTASARPPRKGTPAKSSARPASVEPSVWAQLNDPRLGQVEGALALTGSHEACGNGFGAVDMVGNLHEWVRTDPASVHGTFAGGYYLDTSINGDGCNYRTTAHAHDYHDYSTGFRCCADPAAAPVTATR